MSETELGQYLASQQKVLEGQQGDFLTGSLVQDYWQTNNYVGVTFGVGVKKRWIGSAFYLVAAGIAGSKNGWVSSTGAGNYVFATGGQGMSSWGYVGSGTG